MIDNVLLIASILTAVTGILAFVYKLYNFFRKIEENYEQMNKTIKQNTVYILKIAIMSEEMPLIDRIHAGEQYVAMGGNGLVKKKLNQLVEEYEEREQNHKL